MKRSSRGLFCACAVMLAAGLGWPDTVSAQKRQAPAGARVSGQAVERDSQRGKAAGVQKGKGQASQQGSTRVVVRESWRDRDQYRIVVTEYYGRQGLPPGLARKSSLPPGLQKQLRERGHLPPGLEKHWVVLPIELERRFPPLPPHYVRRALGDDLLVVDVRSNTVVSIMTGVFIRW